MKYYDIMLPVPAGSSYTYLSETELLPGERVRVTLGRQKLTGIVLQENLSPQKDIKYKYITERPDNEPLFNGSYLELIKRLSSYYCTNLGMVLHGVLSKSILESDPEPKEIKEFEREILTLNDAQISVHNAVEKELFSGFSTHLVHGVTGSGKTEIFVELAEKVIKSGKQVLYLVPEISLTPQMEDRLSRRIGFDVLAYHSKKTPKKRKEIFWSCASGDLKMIMGARSALFLPAKDIGLIIVDEEHESSYKQEENPAYHLRDMAVMYGQILDIPVILSSATPSIESWQNAQTGKYRFHSIPCRPDTEMPDIEIVDMKNEEAIGGILSEKLYDGIYEALNRDEQVILLINRKGYSHTMYCHKCGEILNCSNCSVALTYYKSKGHCKCNYCSQEVRIPKCHSCGSDDIRDYGAGTEKVAEALEEMFQEKILRLDTENANTYNKLSKMLKSFENGEHSIMAGTQLVAKGLDFKNVTLAGVINIDNMFALPDFRSAEHAYQLLVQVSGRAGRASKKGKVIIQTNMPEMDVFKRLECGDTSFYENELKRRTMFSYPPFSKMARISFSHTKEGVVKDAAVMVYNTLKSADDSSEIFYPAQAPVYKIQNRFRYSIVIKSKSNSELSRLIKIAAKILQDNAKSTLRMKIDRDPHSFL